MSDADNEFEPGRRNTLLDWIKGLGLPVASLFVSGAIFLFQSQQQAFERQLSNIEDGYRFYFEHRTALERHADADQEETLLKLISNTFPNVFCNVRADLHARVAAAEALDTPNGFDEGDRQMLLVMITTRDAPERMPLSGSTELPLFWQKASNPPKCPTLDALDSDGAAQQTAIIDDAPSAADSDPSASASAQPAPAGSAPAAADATLAAPAPDTSEAPKQNAEISAPPKVAGSAAPVESKARKLARVLDSRLYRVFFQIGASGGRDPRSIDPLRSELAMNGFRVMRGVEQISSMPDQPEVRYFGPDEEARARDLASILDDRFKGEGLTFKPVAIGDRFPTMPRTTLEVWLPDPAGAVPGPKPEIKESVAKSVVEKARPSLKQGL